MDSFEQLDTIAHHCLAAHTACGDTQPALKDILEVALLEVGFRIANLYRDQETSPDEVTRAAAGAGASFR